VAGQLRVVVERLDPPVTVSVNVVGVCPLLVKVTEPEAGVGELVVADMLAVLAEMLGTLSPVPATVR
jgi:hypothetical protein